MWKEPFEQTNVCINLYFTEKENWYTVFKDKYIMQEPITNTNY